MSSESAIASARIYFSYNQFYVFDKSIESPECTWTQLHLDQGFARRERNAAFGTLLQFGHGELSVHMGPYEGREDHERVVAVPLEVPSGEVVVVGPEEFEDTRVVTLAAGHYRLTVAQAVLADDHEQIDLYFEKLDLPLKTSRVIVADAELRPPSPLLETADEVAL